MVIRMNMLGVARKFYRSFSDWYTVRRLTSEAKAIADMPTYFPEYSGQRKTHSQMVRENVAHLKRYKEVNSFYMLYGLDIQGSDANLYIDYLSFMNTRNVQNRVCWTDSQVVLLRDKFLFYKYLSSHGISVADVFALLDHGKLFTTKMDTYDESLLRKKENFFIKSIDGECASFVKRVKNFDEYKKIYAQMDHSKRYILQDSLVQCDEMNRLNPRSINTMRIVTVMKDGNVSILTALLRVGTEKTGNVDNWAAGGLAVGIENNGYLKEHGFYKPQFGQKVNCHPDTGIRFSEFEVPMFEQAKELVCNAHKSLYGVHSIGWDVAFTQNGPVLIEGNDNWEISLQQACDRPLKADWLDAIKK